MPRKELFLRRKQKSRRLSLNTLLGLLRREKYNKVVDIWLRANDLMLALMDGISKESVVNREGQAEEQDSFNSAYMYADSGARGLPAQSVSLLVCVVSWHVPMGVLSRTR